MCESGKIHVICTEEWTAVLICRYAIIRDAGHPIGKHVNFFSGCACVKVGARAVCAGGFVGLPATSFGKCLLIHK